MKKSALTIAVLAASMAGTAIAAVSNPTAPTATSSSATTDVTITRGDGIMLSGLDLVDFGVQAVTPAAPITDDVCVYATVGGEYTVTASSANAGGTTGFQMADVPTGTTSFVEYSVSWTDDNSTTPLVEATTSAQQTGGNQTETNCVSDGGSNASYTVAVDNATFTVAPIGIAHRDTLTILVTLN